MGLCRQVKFELQHDEGDHGEREAHEEAPAPSERVGDQATQERTGHRRNGHDSPHVAGIATTLARRDDRSHDRLDERGEATHRNALQRAGNHEHADRAG